MRSQPQPQETMQPSADQAATGVRLPTSTARNKIQASRNEIQTGRNKIQGKRNKIKAERNEIQIANRSDSFDEIKIFQCVTADSS
jgi:hypothetical protein